MSLERRKYKRIKEENKVIIEPGTNGTKTENGKELYAFTEDISLHGTRLLSDKNFPVGSVLTMNLSLSRTKQIVRLKGRVKWIKEIYGEDLFEIGMEFIHEASKTVLALITHLYQKEGMPPDMDTEGDELSEE